MVEIEREPAIEIGVPVAIADGVFRLSLPMRANSGHVNSYLLVDGDGLVIIDTGNRTDETRVILEGVLAGPLAAHGVRRILLTHSHPDHAGNAQWLAERTGVPVSLPDAEHDALHRLWRESIKHGSEVTAFFRRWGLPEALDPSVLGLLKYFRHGCPVLACSTETLADGSRFRAAGRTWRVVYGFGHTPANAALLADDGLLIAGDHVLPRINPNVSVWWGWIDDPLREYLLSIREFGRVPATRVLPAHGPVFGDLAGRVQEIRRFHRHRLHKALDFCRESSRTAYEAIPAVLGKSPTSPVIALVIGQVLAVFAFLEEEGCVVRTDDHPLRFVATPQADARLAAWFADLPDDVETVEAGGLEEQDG